VEAVLVDVARKVEMLACYQPRGRNEMARDSDREPLAFEHDPLACLVSEYITEQKVDVELGATLGPSSGLTESDGRGDRTFASPVQVIPIPPPSRLLEQSRDVREKLLVIQPAGQSKLVRIGVESLGNLVGMMRHELAQVRSPRLGSAHEKSELPNGVTPRAAHHRRSERRSNPAAP
jgi:hypothetical protein